MSSRKDFHHWTTLSGFFKSWTLSQYVLVRICFISSSTLRNHFLFLVLDIVFRVDEIVWRAFFKSRTPSQFVCLTLHPCSLNPSNFCFLSMRSLKKFKKITISNWIDTSYISIDFSVWGAWRNSRKLQLQTGLNLIYISIDFSVW